MARSVVIRMLFNTAVILVTTEQSEGGARPAYPRPEIGHAFMEVITFFISAPNELKLRI